MQEVRVGIIGYKFMGKAHSHAYHDIPLFFPDVPKPVKQVICGRDASDVEKARQQFGWAHAVTDWREVVARDDVDLIDISAPSDVHHEIVLAAARHKKHVFCEKPLALTLQHAREMLAAVQEAGVVHMIGFNYRFAPAVQLAKSLIASGRLGTIYHFRGWFLQDWIVDPEFPLVWRLRKEVAGSGALGDLGAHVIDMARFLVGEISEVVGLAETFIKRRPLAAEMTGLSASGEASGEYGEVTVDDATVFLARFANGAIGTFEATRFAPGHRCTHAFEINGSKGSVRFDFERMNELEVFFRDDDADVQGFRRILATDPPHAFADRWWPAGHGLGYEHTIVHEVVELLAALRDGRQPVPNFEDGLRCQAVLEAVERSIAERAWVKVEI
ncbi:oxidoreductase [Alicyclobacillus cellulosilyticus]|uniref:Oxidoreductase n=1 Tax=Alicyclobacillus cellulosilyticus TaxID=1003997 RepID=A0A917K5R6_9BACL|nr:Gfo/Idh/MocA family oxidoreductase [Alicyclobacillus cellulosilyticus]GGJ02056.1 oxidoreductase [Alicyclobacillus cellulosilyticus]